MAAASPYLTVYRDGRPMSITGLEQFVGRVGNCKGSATREGDTLKALILRGGGFWNRRLAGLVRRAAISTRMASRSPLSSLPIRLIVDLTGDGLARSLGVYRFWPNLSCAPIAQLRSA
jgi:hypothetical protein